MNLDFLGNERPITLAAVKLAVKFHGDQKRKWTGTPYYEHPIEVTRILLNNSWVDDQTSAAAILHDTLEDTNIPKALIQGTCGSKTLRIVNELTNTTRFPDNKEMQEKINLDRLSGASKAAKMIKAADILHNSRDIVESNPSYAPKYLLKKIRTLSAVETDTPMWILANKEIGEIVRKVENIFLEDQRKDRDNFRAAMMAVDKDIFLASTQQLKESAIF